MIEQTKIAFSVIVEYNASRDEIAIFTEREGQLSDGLVFELSPINQVNLLVEALQQYMEVKDEHGQHEHQ